MSDTMYGWGEYFKAILKYNNPVDAYIQAKEEGLELGFNSDESWVKGLRCFHTYLAEKEGVSRELFAAMAGLGSSSTTYEVETEDYYHQFDISIEDDEIVIYGPVVGISEVHYNSMRPAKTPTNCEWEEPWPGASEDLPLDAVKEVFDNGSFHMCIVKCRTSFRPEHLPAMIDFIERAGCKKLR